MKQEGSFGLAACGEKFDSLIHMVQSEEDNIPMGRPRLRWVDHVTIDVELAEPDTDW